MWGGGGKREKNVKTGGGGLSWEEKKSFGIYCKKDLGEETHLATRGKKKKRTKGEKGRSHAGILEKKKRAISI